MSEAQRALCQVAVGGGCCSICVPSGPAQEQGYICVWRRGVPGGQLERDGNVVLADGTGDKHTVHSLCVSAPVHRDCSSDGAARCTSLCDFPMCGLETNGESSGLRVERASAIAVPSSSGLAWEPHRGTAWSVLLLLINQRSNCFLCLFACLFMCAPLPP